MSKKDVILEGAKSEFIRLAFKKENGIDTNNSLATLVAFNSEDLIQAAPVNDITSEIKKWEWKEVSTNFFICLWVKLISDTSYPMNSYKIEIDYKDYTNSKQKLIKITKKDLYQNKTRIEAKFVK